MIHTLTKDDSQLINIFIDIIYNHHTEYIGKQQNEMLENIIKRIRNADDSKKEVNIILKELMDIINEINVIIEEDISAETKALFELK